ncbi:proteoglycan 4 isoform X3 [Perca fluviatilis]|uniref:proteoglycan 4 isoform X2 n=1 Tax=Perca fluviatilis TaxID=8168 RepID=UPI0019634139|nr:proteoglycan 4 isoform X2 [Perca fluviatilis]XP_039641981.1 proteoglycan 4 isoform X3 [Perca fluviatilis]
MEFVEGSRGIYRPIRVLFDTTIYKRALQLCWHMKSYKTNIALVIELLRLQRESSIPSKVTVEDMTDLLVEQSKATVRVQLWEFELEDFDEEDAKPLLMLVWEVINSMKMRDIEFEARRLLQSPEDIPPCFQHPKLVNLAQEYGRSLTQQLQSAPSSKLLGPRDVVMEVLPKVLQGFWLPPPSTFLNMPSQQLSEMAVGVTKFVLDRVSTALSTVHHRVNFSRSIRDSMVLSIQETVRQMYPQDVLRRGLNCFAAEVLNTIVDAAVKEVLVLFQSQTDTHVPANSSTKNDCTQHTQVGDLNEEPGLEEDGEPIQDPESSVLFSPPTPLTPNAEPAANIFLDETVSFASIPRLEADSAVVPALPSSVLPTDEPLAITVIQDGLTISQIEPAEQFTPETDVAEVSSPPLPLTPATEHPVTTSVLDSNNMNEKTTRKPDSSAEPTVTASALNSEDLSEKMTREPDSVLASAPTPTVTPADEPPTITVVQDGLTISQIEPAEQPAPKANFATSALNSEDLSEQVTREPDSVAATAPTPTVTPADEPPTITVSKVVQDGLTISQIEPAEQPAPKADFAKRTSPPLPMTPNAEPPVITLVLNGEDVIKELSREPDSAVTAALQALPITHDAAQDDLTISQVKVEKKSGVQRFFSWFRKTLCCCCLPEDAD